MGVGRGDRGLVLVIGNKLERAARNWPPKLHLLTLPRAKMLSPDQKGALGVGVVLF